MPDAKTMGRLGQVIGPDVVAGLQQRIVKWAVEKKVVRGRKMRLDTTVVETNIHYPTDSSLLGDGTRVWTRLMGVARRGAKARRGNQQRRGLYKGLLSLSRKIAPARVRLNLLRPLEDLRFQ